MAVKIGGNYRLSVSSLMGTLSLITVYAYSILKGGLSHVHFAPYPSSLSRLSRSLC